MKTPLVVLLWVLSLTGITLSNGYAGHLPVKARDFVFTHYAP